MANIYQVISVYIRPYYKIIFFLLILGILLLTSYYAYQKWGQNKPSPNADIYNPVGHKETNIYFFFADWCPHCKKAKPSWSSFSNKYDGKIVNDYKIVCVSVDCTDAEKPEIAQMISQYNITSYPTVLMVKDGSTYVFDAKITTENLEEFVQINQSCEDIRKKLNEKGLSAKDKKQIEHDLRENNC